MRWVRVVGIVVAVDEFYGRRVFTVDDSSGACVETFATFTPPPKPDNSAAATVKVTNGSTIDAKGSKTKASTVTPKTGTAEENQSKTDLPYNDLDVGHVVDVKGKLSTFRDEMQIEIIRLTTLKSTEQELLLWERRTKFRRDVLERPWVLTKDQIRRCQREAEPKEDKAARKKRRLKAAMARESSRTNQDDKRHNMGKENRDAHGINGYG